MSKLMTNVLHTLHGTWGVELMRYVVSELIQLYRSIPDAAVNLFVGKGLGKVRGLMKRQFCCLKRVRVRQPFCNECSNLLLDKEMELQNDQTGVF